MMHTLEGDYSYVFANLVEDWVKNEGDQHVMYMYMEKCHRINSCQPFLTSVIQSFRRQLDETLIGTENASIMNANCALLI